MKNQSQNDAKLYSLAVASELYVALATLYYFALRNSDMLAQGERYKEKKQPAGGCFFFMRDEIT